MTTTHHTDTIIALATAQGVGAIAVIRLSGSDAIAITNSLFYAKNTNKSLTSVLSHTVHLGYLKNKETIIDEVLVSVFKNPHSYTGEDVVEISCHGSVYIQQSIVQLFLENGVRHADAGEFTLRAFLNGKMDLSQTEAVADLINSQSKATRDVAIKQMRGGFSSDLRIIREKLIHFASMIELELDFSEEDVAFADRNELINLVTESIIYLTALIESFRLGNAIKNGINTTIVGRPNAGKSTLLNALLNEDRAIVTDIAGTTRDVLEETLIIDGIEFRFIDTAGLRKTTDIIERIGVEKALEKVNNSAIYIYLFDISNTSVAEVKEDLDNLPTDIPHLVIANKVDLVSDDVLSDFNNADIGNLSSNTKLLYISAKKTVELATLLKEDLLKIIDADKINTNQTIITNSRHFEALSKAKKELLQVQNGLEAGISGDLLSVDIRQALFYIGSITGEVTTDDLLGNIFANFCIGK